MYEDRQETARPLSVYEAHQQAIQEWHEACHQLAQAQERRERAAATLQKCEAALGEHVAAARHDPTSPQPLQQGCGTASIPGNGQLGKQRAY